jgi:hypothetical protein
METDGLDSSGCMVGNCTSATPLEVIGQKCFGHVDHESEGMPQTPVSSIEGCDISGDTVSASVRLQP